MRAREWGDPDQAPTLLWPGLGFTGLYFTPLARALPHAIALDPPGHGASPDLHWEAYELHALADLANDAVLATGADSFVGHSWGATVGAVLGAKHPEQLRALVLVDGGFISGEARAEVGVPVHETREELLAYVRERTTVHDSWGAAFDELREIFGGEWPEYADSIARDLYVEEGGTVRERASIEGAAAILEALAVHDPVACAGKIRDGGLRTLLAVTGRTPYLAAKRREWERFAAAGAPAVELHVDDAVGHHPLLEAPETYIALLAVWLAARR